MGDWKKKSLKSGMVAVATFGMIIGGMSPAAAADIYDSVAFNEDGCRHTGGAARYDTEVPPVVVFTYSGQALPSSCLYGGVGLHYNRVNSSMTYGWVSVVLYGTSSHTGGRHSGGRLMNNWTDV